MKRGLTPKDIINASIEYWEFEEPWLSATGKPEGVGTWIIGGQAASGKTTFVLQLCKYLLKFGRVYYNSREMKPLSGVMQKVLIRTGMQDVKGFIVRQESIDDMIDRLEKHKSPNIVFVDSVQHSFIRKKQYSKLKEMFPNKLFIWITHFDNRNKAEGSIGQFIWYDADIKMTVEGYRMFADSRYLDGGKGQPYTIWKEGAATYWGENN